MKRTIKLIIILCIGLFAVEKYNKNHNTDKNKNSISTIETHKEKNTVTTSNSNTQSIITTSSSIKEKINTTEVMSKSNELIIKDSPAVFDNFTPFNFNGVEISIDKLKICSDLSNPESPYNFYYVIMEYTVFNNTGSYCSWEIKQTGNIYGSFIFDGYDRYLGGNKFIKDDDIVSTWGNKSILSENESVKYSMVLVIDREIDDPPKGLMLCHNSKMTITLPITINNTKNELTINLNAE